MINGGKTIITMETNNHYSLKLFFISIGILYITSCGNNIIHLDCKNRIVYSPDYTITHLSVSIINKNAYYTIEKKRNRKGDTYIKLDSVCSDYELIIYLPKHHFDIINNKNPIRIDAIPFYPNEEYEITNTSFGDATPYKILFKTDKKGKIIKSEVRSVSPFEDHGVGSTDHLSK